MSLKIRLFLCFVSAILFVPAWYTWGSGLFLFIAFIPLLFIEEDLIKSGKNTRQFFLLPFLTFLIWNILTTWWIKNASFAGLLAALLVNTVMMSFPFWLFTYTHRKLGDAAGYFSLLFYWLAFEYFYLHAEISWTWLNLGNGFAQNIKMIQWYEYTGTLGGTLWVLAVNLLLFKALSRLRKYRSLKKASTELSLGILLFLIPVVFSGIKFRNYTENKDPREIVVIQPNIDPYKKFNDIPPDQQMDILVNLADSLCNQNTDYLVVPETFVNNNVWLGQLERNPSIQRIKSLTEKYPRIKIVFGATTYKLYENKESASPTARPYRKNFYYDSFNTAFQIDSTGFIPDYHKSELVVGVEKMPYTQYLGFLRKIMLHLGGTFRSHGTQDYRESFSSPQDDTRVGPVICYESIFGEFVTKYVSDADANLLFVITNDGWWGDTPGYVQHNSFSALRAIENRRSIARSANTGISSFFNQKGEMLQSVGWWERTAIKETLNTHNEKTFYTRHGDYIGRIASFISLALLLYSLVTSLIRRKNS